MKIALLGCSGSVGRTAINVIRRYADDFEIVLLANRTDRNELFALSKEFSVRNLFSRGVLVINGKDKTFDPDYLSYPETYLDADIVLNAISGIDGVLPSVAAIRAGKILALANKESVVCAGRLIGRLLEGDFGRIRPIDSEHSTLWQCMDGRRDVKSLLITCSGGAFRDYDVDRLRVATAADALAHPTWKMGKKITVDCATLVNKGFEIIEAKRLFGIEDVDAVLHRESVVHGLVEMKDGALIAGLSYPDMELPVQYALTYPDRKETNLPRIRLQDIGRLSFAPIAEERFPCFSLIKGLSSCGDYAGIVLSAADEVAVDAFLCGKIGYFGIYDAMLSAVTEFGSVGPVDSETDVRSIEKAVKEYTLKYIGENV